MPDLTPDNLFSSFQAAAKSWDKTRIGVQAVEEFKTVQDKQPFLKPTIQYLQSEQVDRARSWGTNILELIGGDEAIACLTGLLDGADSPEIKRGYLYTRFFALRGLNTISQAPAAAAKVDELCGRIWPDEAEDYLVRTLAAALLAQKGDASALAYLNSMLAEGRYKEYWPAIRTLRSQREAPVPALADTILGIMRDKTPGRRDFRWQAINTAGSFRNNPDVSYELGKIVREEEYSFLRLEAVKSLGKLGDSGAKDYVLHALQDEDAEIRYQAALAIKKMLAPENATGAIVQVALDPGTSADQRANLIDGLRLIDPTRAIPTAILSKELTAEDRQRAETAERLLIDLGGWAAVQRLSQRRLTLNHLDNLLSESEKLGHHTFEGTIRQARFSFYFAMAVNIIIVATGIIFIGLAVRQLIVNPQNLAAWILPGATGVLGVLINLFFNNPRQNARDDLTALMNATVIFLGFLRRLNEIDATFKHAYLEDSDFDARWLRETLAEIESTVAETVQLSYRQVPAEEAGKPAVQGEVKQEKSKVLGPVPG